MDFNFWGKQQVVYSERIINLQHLMQRIKEAVALGTPDILQNVWGESCNTVWTFIEVKMEPM